ncbi:hypothetical protein DFH11DRAFT_951695 [Phellopilus nigrolimitatus]|nr:hypothetical protein DFH11DRAFT_951695 [Phellopilus nigrolimitatus]
MGWFSKHLRPQTSSDEPPAWTPAVERSRTFGLLNEAPEDEFEKAEAFCAEHPLDAPRLLASSDVDRIRAEGCKAWGLVAPSLSRFRGTIRDVQSDAKGAPKVVEVATEPGCGDACIFSNYPIMAGLYDVQGKEGIYYEVTVLKMDGVIAIGTSCLPYPEYRFPGWNRLSAGLHLDDMQKFFEDPRGGRPYDGRLRTLAAGDVFGCGYSFATKSLFYTHNGKRLADAFRGLYLPRTRHDVYAAIGVGGPGANRFIVNFGGDNEAHLFRWLPAREWGWQVDGHVGRMAGSSGEGPGEELPSYSQVA